MADHTGDTAPDHATVVNPPDGDGASADWRAGLPDDLTRFAANLASPVDAVRMAAGLRQKLSRAIVPPEPGAPAEDVAEFRRRLGVPDTPDGYRATFPDGLPAYVRPGVDAAADEGDFLHAMHAVGATPETVQAAVDWYAARVGAAEEELSASRAADTRQASEALLREWGGDYERNLDHARRALHAYGGERLVERLDRAGLGNDPVVMHTFHRVGREMAEDDIFADGFDDGGRRKLEERAGQLRARKDRWTNGEVDRELRDIMERLHGTQPVHPR